MEIRYLTPDDDKITVSRIYQQSWRHAYHGILPQDYLNAIPDEHWVSALENNSWNTLICIENDRIIGTSSFCKSRFEQFADWGEIISIYLLPEFMGKGFGKMLLTRALSELKKLGYDSVFLWVLEQNTRARNFYEKFGFLPSDHVLCSNIGGKDLREIRYIYHNL